MPKNRTYILTLLFLVACGGGGGGSSETTPTVSVAPTPPPAPSPSTFEELKADFEGYYEYRRHWGLKSVNSSSAHARGATGAGITIGITDSGLDVTHVEIDQTRISSNSDLEYSNYVPSTKQKRHGTMVTSIAAGTLDKTAQSPMHGVAFNSQVLFVAIQLSDPDPEYDPIDLGDTDSSGDVTNADNLAAEFAGIDNFFSSLFEFYNFYDADIVNNSYGFAGNIIDYTESQVRTAFPKTIAEMSQIDTPDEDKTIYVWAAGNAGSYADQGVNYFHPELLPGMAYFIEEIQGHSIAVVSVDEDGQISDFSSMCGVSRNYCIAAPGGSVNVAYPTSSDDYGIYPSDKTDPNYNSCVEDNSCYAAAGGTSFAAPFVTGGLAVMAEYFEGQLGNTELVNRLFTTANKSGVYNNPEIYGHGLMDLAAATSPVGQVSAMLGQNLYGPMTSAEFTSINLTNPSFGDSISRGLNNKSVIFFDELLAPFRRPLSGIISNYGNQIMSLHGYDEMDNYNTKTSITADSFFQVGLSSYSNHSYELITPNHLLNTKSSNNQYFAYFNNAKNTFMSHGINAGWALGIFQDEFLRSKINLRSKFNNPWMNFTAAGSAIGSIKTINSNFDIAYTISSGRNKFQSNEIFNDTNSSSVALIEIQSKLAIPSLQIGLLTENDSQMGLSGSGALNGQGNQLTSFVGVTDSMDILGGKFFGSLYLGQTADSKNKTGMISSVNDLRSSSFGLGYLKSSIFNKNDLLTFTIDQPIRVESGNLNLNVPVYRTKRKNVLFDSLNINLSPSGREINSKLEYSSSYKILNYDFALGYKSDPYHIKYMDDYWYVSLGFNFKM